MSRLLLCDEPQMRRPPARERRADPGPSSIVSFPHRPGKYKDVLTQRRVCGPQPPSARARDKPVEARLDCLPRIVGNATRARILPLSLSSLSGHPRLRTSRNGPANTVTPSGKGTVARRIACSPVSSANTGSLSRSSSDVSAGGSLAARRLRRFALFIRAPCSRPPRRAGKTLLHRQIRARRCTGFQPEPLQCRIGTRIPSGRTCDVTGRQRVVSFRGPDRFGPVNELAARMLLGDTDRHGKLPALDRRVVHE